MLSAALIMSISRTLRFSHISLFPHSSCSSHTNSTGCISCNFHGLVHFVHLLHLVFVGWISGPIERTTSQRCSSGRGRGQFQLREYGPRMLRKSWHLCGYFKNLSTWFGRGSESPHRGPGLWKTHWSWSIQRFLRIMAWSISRSRSRSGLALA